MALCLSLPSLVLWLAHCCILPSSVVSSDSNILPLTHGMTGNQRGDYDICLLFNWPLYLPQFGDSPPLKPVGCTSFAHMFVVGLLEIFSYNKRFFFVFGLNLSRTQAGPSNFINMPENYYIIGRDKAQPYFWKNQRTYINKRFCMLIMGASSAGVLHLPMLLLG